MGPWAVKISTFPFVNVEQGDEDVTPVIDSPVPG